MEEEIFVKEYIVSDETVLNRYGFRVMTDGIRLTNYLKSPTVRFQHIQGAVMLPIGRATDLYKKDGKLYARLELSSHTEFERTIIKKIKAGQMTATSIGFVPIKTTNELSFLLEGQTGETVVESELLEISITDVPANGNAVGLSLIPSLVNHQKSKNIMSNLKNIALAFGLPETATEEEILKKISEQSAARQKQELKAEIAAACGNVENIDVWIELALKDRENTFKALAATFQKSTATATTGEETVTYVQTKTPPPLDTPISLSAIIAKNTQGGQGTENLSFDYLQKNEPEKLLSIKQSNPQLYDRLFEERKKR